MSNTNHPEHPTAAPSSAATGTTPPRLVLASASPRRQELLREAGYEFVTHPPGIDEDDFPPGTLPSDAAIHIARAKARAVAPRYPDSVVLAADTVVAFGDEIIGKPEDALHAKHILRLLSGTTHVVITAVVVATPGSHSPRSSRVMSAVRMRALSEREIERYLHTGQWRGKAGAYGIQDDDPFVTCVAGCRTNIVGLPMTTASQLLAGAGITPVRAARPQTEATS